MSSSSTVASTASPPRAALFVVHAEYGQANVVLAVAQEVARRAEFTVSIASSEGLRKRVDEINRCNGLLSHPIQFIALPGVSMEEVATRLGDNWNIASNAHPPGLLNAIRSFKTISPTILGWEPWEYLEIYQACLEILKDVNPSVLVCDILMWFAQDAARSLGMEYITIQPTSIKDITGPGIPVSPLFLKWPVCATGFKYPLSKVNVVKNVVASLVFSFMLLRSKQYTGIVKARKNAGIQHEFPMFSMYRKRQLYLNPYLEEADYVDPAGFPSDVVSCGPIVLPSTAPLRDTDGELLKWLERRPTIMINLGTHFGQGSNAAIETAKGIRNVIMSRSDIQFLWKLKKGWEEDSALTEIIGSLVESECLRIVSWLNADPYALLATGFVICSVHHGGANSYYEACRAGVPQVVLPVWWDTYEYAERARYSGIGLIGNVGSAPSVDSYTFSAALFRVIDEQAFTKRAQDVANACKRRGEGRNLAAGHVIEWARENRSKLRRE